MRIYFAIGCPVCTRLKSAAANNVSVKAFRSRLKEHSARKINSMTSMCHFPERASHRCRRKNVLFTNFSSSLRALFKFIFLSALEKISTVVEMEASCWIKFNYDPFPRLSHSLYIQPENKVKYDGVECRKSLFLLTALNLSFSYTKKRRFGERWKKCLQLFACVSDRGEMSLS